MADRRILFAEFMGRSDIQEGYCVDAHGVNRPLPDPDNNDSDCMELLARLELTHYIWIEWASGDVQIGLTSKETLDEHTWEGSDYKQGICDLSEPIVTAILQREKMLQRLNYLRTVTDEMIASIEECEELYELENCIRCFEDDDKKIKATHLGIDGMGNGLFVCEAHKCCVRDPEPVENTK